MRFVLRSSVKSIGSELFYYLRDQSRMKYSSSPDVELGEQDMAISNHRAQDGRDVGSLDESNETVIISASNVVLVEDTPVDRPQEIHGQWQNQNEVTEEEVAADGHSGWLDWLSERLSWKRNPSGGSREEGVLGTDNSEARGGSTREEHSQERGDYLIENNAEVPLGGVAATETSAEPARSKSRMKHACFNMGGRIVIPAAIGLLVAIFLKDDQLVIKIAWYSLTVGFVWFCPCFEVVLFVFVGSVAAIAHEVANDSMAFPIYILLYWMFLWLSEVWKKSEIVETPERITNTSSPRSARI